MKIAHKTIANWGNFPVAEAQVAEAENAAEARDFVRGQPRLIARGNGRCYGDAALGPVVLSTLRLNQILDFDVVTGEIHCQAGVLLADILEKTLPLGWFFHVTPGIKAITVGGAIASDVHGKNHPKAGCFSNWLISFELLTASGEILTCSRTENAALFWQTCGGMGWTGVVLSARFRLRKIESGAIRQTTLKANNLDALFDAFEKNKTSEYAAAWVDCLPKGADFGRGAAFFGEHETENQASAGEPGRASKPKANVPFFAPNWLLNPLSIRLHNDWIFFKNRPGERLVDLDSYFYPLDKIANWNRLYGRRGFVQYQFCLPENLAIQGIAHILEAVQASADTPFLTVLKRHGERPPEALHSFPIRGYSLALDFPRTKTVFDLVKKLDALVWRFEGKIYLTKDACSDKKMGRLDPLAFGDPKFYSLLKARLTV